MAEQEQPQGNVRKEYDLGRSGLNMDSSVNQIEKGKLTYALNAALENFDGNAVNYQNEQGNELCLNFPTDFHLIGTHFIQEQNKHIFFLTNPETGASQIGYMDNNDCNYVQYIQGDCLNFDINYPILKAVHKITNLTTEIYWTDGLNPRRYLDLKNPPWLTTIGVNLCDITTHVGTVDCNKITVQPNFNIPEINVNSIVNGGDLTAGVYQFAIQYTNASGIGYTSYYSITNPTPISNSHLTTADFNYPVGKSIVLDITNIDITGYFQYFNLAVIKTINNVPSAQVVGTYFIENISRQITYTGQNVTAIPITTAEIFEKYPYYDIAQDVTAVESVLVWDQLTTIDRVNYQSIANNITLNWKSYRIPNTENYSDPLNATNLRGYLRDEVYTFEIVFLLNNGKQTDSFHIPGRTSNLNDLTTVNKSENPDYIGSGTSAPYWKIYNTAILTGYDAAYIEASDKYTTYKGPYQYGQFSYWESEETYPCNTALWGSLAGQKIRHHKFPDVLVSPIFETVATDYNHPVIQNKAIFPIGVDIDVAQVNELISQSNLTKQQKDQIAGFKIVRGDRSTNSSIVAKGIIRNVGKYTRETPNDPNSTYYYYPNYPYNDLNKDPFLLEKNNAYNSQCQTYSVNASVAGTIQYTNCYTSAIVSVTMNIGVTEICSITTPVVLSGTAIVTQTSGNAYTLSSYGSTVFKYTDSITSATTNVTVVVNNPQTVNSTVAPTFVSGTGKYSIVYNNNNVNTYCYPNNLDGFTTDESKYRMVFNSPETSFGQPVLGNILKAESVIYGGGRAHFVQVKKNAEYKLISESAQADALNSSYNIATTTGSLDATAMFTAYQAYLTIYINGITRRNFAYSFNSIGSYDYSTSVPNGLGVKQRELDLYQYLIPGVQSVGDIHDVNNFQRESSVYLKTLSTLTPLPYSNKSPNIAPGGTSLISDDSRITISGSNNCSSPEMLEDINVVSYYGSIKNNIVNQWGPIYSYITVDTGFQRLFNALPTNDEQIIFGGDTFIGKFGFKTKLPFFIDNRVNAPDDSDIFYDEIGNIAYPQYWHSARSILSNYTAGNTVMKNIISVKARHFDCPNNTSTSQNSTTTTSSTSSTTTLSANGNITAGGLNTYYDGKFYLFAYGIPYFYVESSINIDLRQAFNNLEGDFYPHVSSGIPDNWVQQSVVPIQFDNTYTYNVTYSRQNKENYFSHLPPDWETQSYTNYPFRAIYSDRQDNYADNKVNSWLTYAPVSFFDFPQNYGKLVSLDGIQNKAILARFENKSFLYNALLTVNTSFPQAAYLGNPDMFKNPPIDFAETDLGYVGSQNKMLLKIPEGQITVDAKRGQIFLIALNAYGRYLPTDLSGFGSGMNRFLTDHLPFEILKYFPTANTDNHYNGLGLHGVYDSKFDRVIISKLDYIPTSNEVKYDSILQKFYVERNLGGNILIDYIYLTDTRYFCNKSWTLSFNLDTKSWVSFHSYIPNFYIAENNFFYSGLNEGCDLEAVALVEIPTPTSTTTTTTVNYCNLIGTAVNLSPNWVNQNINTYWVCVGVDQHYQQIDTNPYSPTYNTTRTGALYQANSPICGGSDCTLTAGSAIQITDTCSLIPGSAILK